MKSFNHKLLWTIAIVSFLALSHGCDTQKRVNRRLQKLEKKNQSKRSDRGWPNNYTFQEYSDILDEAKVRKAFYEKRKTQARIAKDKKTVAVMSNNIKSYEKKIARLESDKDFYKIYSLRDKEVRLKIKEQEKKQREIEKQKEKIDKKAYRENKAKLKGIKEQQKAQEEIILARRKRLEDRKKANEERYKNHLKEIDAKRKELKKLQAKKRKAPEGEKEYYHDVIIQQYAEIKTLEDRTGMFEAPLDSIDDALRNEEFKVETDTLSQP